MKNVEQGAVPSGDSMEGKTDGDKFNGWVILAGTLLVSLIIALFFGYKNPTQAGGVVFAFILFPLVSYGICAGLTKSMFKRPIGGFGSAVSFFTMWGIVAISHISHVINEDIEHQRIVDAQTVEFEQLQIAPLNAKLNAELKEIEKAKSEWLKTTQRIKLLKPVEVRPFTVNNKAEQLKAQAETRGLADQQTQKQADLVRLQAVADARRKAEIKASQKEEDATSSISNSRQIASGGSSDYYKKIAVERYPDVTRADSPLSVRMGEIDIYLGKIGSPLYQMKEKYLIITEIAASELKIMPVR